MKQTYAWVLKDLYKETNSTMLTTIIIMKKLSLSLCVCVYVYVNRYLLVGSEVTEYTFKYKTIWNSL